MTTINHIICAVRGRPASRSTVTHAIDLALETGARLTFFHVMTAGFVEHATIGPLSVVYNELRDMTEFMLLILCDRARRRGVEQVDYVSREGDIRKQIRQFAIETEAEILVMGRPAFGPGGDVFDGAELERFVAEFEELAGIQVMLVDPGDSVRE
jgi:nucleotide-binding universal stress UspA family protein